MFEQIKRWRLGKQYGYETLFKRQDKHLSGKPGIILAEIGAPEGYEPDFYVRYMEHVFDYTLPPFIQKFVLADRGIALIDPQNPLAREPFEPQQLVDMHGSFVNCNGRPYVDCKVTWKPPGVKKNPWDHGYFLYTDEGQGGAPDICQKTGAKVVGWYFGKLLPEAKIAWAYQCKQVYEDAVAALQTCFPNAEFRHARFVYEDSLSQAVEELLESGCETIIYQSFCDPVYSDFEEYNYSMPLVHRYVNGRGKTIFADQLGNQPQMREAYVQMIRDHLTQLPHEASILLILSKHGHPFKKETQDIRGEEYRMPLEAKVRQLMENWEGHWDIVWSDDEFADEYWDPKNTRLETFAAYQMAIAREFDYALEVPTDFIAENTDLMILHAMKKFKAFSAYDPYEPIPYPDWDQPLLRTFREGKTTGIYTSCPVGPYRKYVVEAIVASISDVLGEFG